MVTRQYYRKVFTHNKRKSVVVERFIRFLKSKIYKYLTSISKTMYINKLSNIVDEFNNAYHKTTRLKVLDVKPSIYIDSDVENNDKDPKFKVGDLLEYYNTKKYFAKNYPKNCS